MSSGSRFPDVTADCASLAAALFYSWFMTCFFFLNKLHWLKLLFWCWQPADSDHNSDPSFPCFWGRKRPTFRISSCSLSSAFFLDDECDDGVWKAARELWCCEVTCVVCVLREHGLAVMMLLDKSCMCQLLPLGGGWLNSPKDEHSEEDVLNSNFKNLVFKLFLWTVNEALVVSLLAVCLVCVFSSLVWV